MLARHGIDFELAPKTVYIQKLYCIGQADAIYTLRVECSSGTYVRQLCNDLARRAQSCLKTLFIWN